MIIVYRFEKTKSFEKNLKKLSVKEQKAVADKLKKMAENPYHPSLRTKKIQGLIDIFECSVNMDIRIIWKYKDDRLILLIEIGHHDIL